MKCEKCGFPHFDQKGKCLFCGAEAPINNRPPIWWDIKDEHSSSYTKQNTSPAEPAPKASYDKPEIEMFICTYCHKQSLFLNTVSGFYDCVNIKCPSNQKQPVILNNWRKPLTQQAFKCPTCGSLVNYGTRFCGQCRTSLTWSDQQQVQNPPFISSVSVNNSVENEESRAWFGNQYYDSKAMKWKTPKPSIINQLGKMAKFAGILLLIAITIIALVFILPIESLRTMKTVIEGAINKLMGWLWSFL